MEQSSFTPDGISALIQTHPPSHAASSSNAPIVDTAKQKSFVSLDKLVMVKTRKTRNRSEGEKNPPIRNRSDLQHFQQHPQRPGIETRRLSNNIPAPASHAPRSCPSSIHADRMGRMTRFPKMGESSKYHRRVIVQEKRQYPAGTEPRRVQALERRGPRGHASGREGRTKGVHLVDWEGLPVWGWRRWNGDQEGEEVR